MKLEFEISEDFIKKYNIYKDLKYWILLVKWGWPLGGEGHSVGNHVVY